MIWSNTSTLAVVFSMPERPSCSYTSVARRPRRRYASVAHLRDLRLRARRPELAARRLQLAQ
eukprot:8903249-Pyramimonas_sp.AAC.1